MAQVGRLGTRLPHAEPDCGDLAPRRSATRPGRLTLAEQQSRPVLRVPARVRAEALPPSAATASGGVSGRASERKGLRAPD
jgi:hypothetical protein